MSLSSGFFSHRPSLTQICLFLFIGIVTLPILMGCGIAGRSQNVQGVSLYQQGQHHAAIQKFQQAINRRPNDADGYYNLAATYHQLGKRNADQSMLAQAENLYNQTLQYSPNHSDAYRGLAVLLVETKRPDSAFRLIEGWTTRQPHVADARVELARIHEEFGDKKMAIRHLEEALTVDSNSSRAWASLAKLREESGDFAQALANYQRSHSINALQPQVTARIAALQNTIGPGTPVAPVAGARVAGQPNWVPRQY